MRRSRIHVRPNVSKLGNSPRNRKTEVDLTPEIAKPALTKEANETCVKIEPSNDLERTGDNLTTVLFDDQQQKLQTVFLENVESLETVIPEDPIKLEAVLHEQVVHIEEVNSEKAAEAKVENPECSIESAASGASHSDKPLHCISNANIKLDDTDDRPISHISTIPSDIGTGCETSAVQKATLEDYLHDTAPEPDPVIRIDEAVDDNISSHRNNCTEIADDLNPQNVTHDDDDDDEEDYDDPIEPLSPTKSAKNRNLVKAKKEVVPRRRYLKGKDPPDKEKMTMSDMIYWNPINNPMKYSPKINRPQAIFTPHRRNSNSDSEPNIAETQEEENLPVPRLMVGPDGEIMIDEKSLYIQQSLPKISSVVYEDAPTTYSSFREKKIALKWKKRDTILFYRALSSVGTDFSIMAELLKKWKRYDLKKKYKYELKRNTAFVQKILKKCDCLNMDLLDGALAEEIIDDDIEKEVMENQKKSRKKGVPKKAVPNSKESSMQCDENSQNINGSTNIENADTQDVNGSSVPIKKKRTRKTKAQKAAEAQSGTTTIENIVTAISQPIKKKRGRKPKNKVDTIANLESEECTISESLSVQVSTELPVETNQGIEEIGDKQSANQLQVADHTKVADKQGANQPVKKRRGRKPKPKPSEEVDGIAEESTTQPVKKKRGRKPKSDKDADEGPVKRKRGRKPKVLEEEIETDIESSEDSMSDDFVSYSKHQRRTSTLSKAINYNEESDADDISVETIEDTMELCEVEVQLPIERNTDESVVIDPNYEDRKSEVNEQHNDAKENVPVHSEKKKRGRKPKIIREIVSDNLELNSLATTSDSAVTDMQTLPCEMNHSENSLFDCCIELQKSDSPVQINANTEDTNILISLEDGSIKQENGKFGTLHSEQSDGVGKRFISKLIPVVADSSHQNEIALSLDGSAENGVLVSETGEVLQYQVIASADIDEGGSECSADIVHHNITVPTDPNSSNVLLLPLISDSERTLSHPAVKLEQKENIAAEHLHSPVHSRKRASNACVNKTSQTSAKHTNENNRESMKLKTNAVAKPVVERTRLRRGHKALNVIPKKFEKREEDSFKELPLVDLSVSEIASYVTVETEPQRKRKRKDEIINTDSGKRTPKYSDFTVEESDCLSANDLENKIESLPDYGSNLILSPVRTDKCHSEYDKKNTNISDQTGFVESQYDQPSLQTSKCIPDLHTHQNINEVRISTRLPSEVSIASEVKQGDNLCEEDRNASAIHSNSENLSTSAVFCTSEHSKDVSINKEISLPDFNNTKALILKNSEGRDANSKENAASFEGKLVVRTFDHDINFGVHELSSTKESSAVRRILENNGINKDATYGETNPECHVISSMQVTEHTPENGRKYRYATHNTVISHSIRIPITPTFESHKERTQTSLTIPPLSIPNASPESSFSNEHKFSPLTFKTSANQTFASTLIKREENVPSPPLVLLNSSSQKGVVHIFALNSPSRNQSMFLPESVSKDSENIESGGSNPPNGLIHNIIESFNLRKTVVDVNNN